MRHSHRAHRTIWISLTATVLLSGAAFWALSNGYVSDLALSRWAQISSILDTSELRLESLGLLYPHLPVYLLIPFYYIPGLNSPLAPYFLSSLIAGLTLSLWYRHLRIRGFARPPAVALVLLLGTHPVFLWAATDGTEKSLSLLVFYLMCLACSRLLRIGDLRSIIMLGGVLALFFFVDERTLFLFAALLPLLPFFAPLHMLKASILSTFILISLPVIISVGAWIYLNWLYHGEAFHFLTSPESAFIGATQTIEQSVWLKTYGGSFFPALGAAVLLLILFLPVFGWTLWQLRSRSHYLYSMAILGLHPVLAVALATQYHFVEHPLEFLFLAFAAFMSSLLLIPKNTSRRAFMPVFLMIVSCAGGWLALNSYANPEMQAWRSAMVGKTQSLHSAADQRVGRWLVLNPESTLIDSRSAYRVVAYRGDATGLWLPFMQEFKLAERMFPLTAPQVVVIDPRHSLASRDRITQRFPSLFDLGHADYTLALDAPPWRVYRHHSLPPPRTEAP